MSDDTYAEDRQDELDRQRTIAELGGDPDDLGLDGEVCPDCEGYGNCQECDGEGCYECDEHGVCAACDGTGEL